MYRDLRGRTYNLCLVPGHEHDLAIKRSSTGPEFVITFKAANLVELLSAGLKTTIAG